MRSPYVKFFFSLKHPRNFLFFGSTAGGTFLLSNLMSQSMLLVKLSSSFASESLLPGTYCARRRPPSRTADRAMFQSRGKSVPQFDTED
jgi:hypothetical protein